MTSYSYKTLNNTKTPILNNVDIVLILAMEDNNRFDEDMFLLSLAKKTIIQYNKGFRKSAKPPTITEPKYDIVHAYYTAFEYLKEYNNVIILEDDALVINKDPLIYDKIDNFIATTNFDILTFGSFGLFSNYNGDFLNIDPCFFGAAQAIIYSRDSRSKLIEDISSSHFNKGHIDITYIGALTKKFTYKYPLIIQLFPKTENKDSWFTNIFLLYFCNFFITLLRLDKSISGWFLLYFIFTNYISIIILVFLIVLIFYNNNSNVKIVKTMNV
jgi:hypothetical protein